MQSVANSAFIFDVIKLLLFIACGYLAFATYARRTRAPWALALATRRMSVLTLLTLSVVGVKIFEDVITQESGPIDKAVLSFVQENVPAVMYGFFGAVTWMGAAVVMVPVTAALCIGLLVSRRPREAAFLVASMASGWALSYVVKTLVSRARPDLLNATWATWHWGSSFPSGHTLSAAVLSTALTLIAVRIWPSSRRIVLPLAVMWTCLMGLSRMVLGVHWPTDVLAAVCVGVCLPLAFHLFLFRTGPDVQASRNNQIEV